MKKVLLSAGISIFAVLVISLTLNASNNATSGESAPEKRPDIIQIDSMEAFGALERAPVSFPHDTHSEKLATAGKDCSACHEKNPEADGGLVYLFKRMEDTDAGTVRDLYHDACIRCHEETLSKGEESGPVSCNACHTREPDIIPDQVPMGFDNSLHHRHSKAMENKCEACHHEYDKTADKLIYVKGNEGTCRYCHGETTEENRISMQEASHQACIACHQEKTAGGKDAGPMECAGCHSLEQRALIATVDEVPRYDRNQPDAALILPLQTEGETPTTQPVAFDHLKHESTVTSCQKCHHAEIGECAGCHTADGVEKGGGVSLMQSMHKSGTTTSCLGCHTTETREATCAGCHDAMPSVAEQDNGNCSTCHTALPDADTDTGKMTDEEKNALAAALLAGRSDEKPVVSMTDIPETVTIGSMSDQYKQVALPHRKMFLALQKNAAESKLAAWFHDGDTTLCQGCHHNSPAELKPAKCASCHTLPDTDANPLMPALRGAYHQQCIGCHQSMNIQKTGCTDCHEKK
jgi:hypothetical protein